MVRWRIVVVVALAACASKKEERAAPAPAVAAPAVAVPPVAAAPVAVPEVAAPSMPTPPTVAAPTPDEVTPSGSRTVPMERGVPLDQAALGPLPHPFGALEFLRAGTSRDEILSALPNARRDGEDQIVVPVGVEDLMATIDLDYTGHLDVVKIVVPTAAHAQLVQAWGAPTPTGTWFDRARRWRADLDGEILMIGPFVPLAALVGKGPDGLAETQGLIGATPAELTARFGDRIAARDGPGTPIGPKGYGLLLPATDVCKFYTKLDLDLGLDGRVARATLRQCFHDDAGRRAALAALESKWGRAVPARSADDRPMFTFPVPRRRVEAILEDARDRFPAWTITITAR